MRAVAFCLLALLLAGCSSAPSDPEPTSTSSPTATATSTTDTGSANPPDEPRLHRIDIASFAFSPPSLTIAVGDTVEWVNLDGATHTVDSTDGGPLDSGNMARDDTYAFTFSDAGTFAYQCDVHPSMKGSITVA